MSTFSSRILGGYRQLSQQHPLLILACINGALAGASDVIAQGLERPKHLLALGRAQVGPVGEVVEPHTGESIILRPWGDPGRADEVIDSEEASIWRQEHAQWDRRRTARFAAYGFAMAPIVHTWYTYLDRTFPVVTAAGIGTSSWGPVLKRVAADQLGYAPIGMLLFFTVMSISEGGGVSGIRRKMGDNFFHGMLANWAVWPAVQLINFRYVPLFYRLPFVGAVGIVWNAFLSWLNHRPRESSDQHGPIHI